MKIENIQAVADLYDKRTRLLKGLSAMEHFRHADFRLYFDGVPAHSQQDVKNNWGLSEDTYGFVNGNIAHFLRCALTNDLEKVSKELVALGVEL